MWTQVKLGYDQGIYAAVQQPSYGSGREGLLVVTFSGLGQSMSERGFLFSRLRKQVVSVPCRYVQFDYRGHGDSMGSFQQVSVSSMTQDAVEVLTHYLGEGNYSKVICIGHALGAEVASRAMKQIAKAFPGIGWMRIAVSPPSWTMTEASAMFAGAALQELAEMGFLAAERLFPGKDYYGFTDFDRMQLGYLSNWGAHIQHIHGQFLSWTLIEELEEYRDCRCLTEGLGESLWVCGAEDRTRITTAGKAGFKVLILSGVSRYYDHASAADRVIHWITEELRKQSELHPSQLS
ncbi:alpha/beta hydrolase [Paenibacillus tarimensis]|uniref:alpha/beta hydrolase n=1 Tax=Paenibacillus tarimensis TaxID=416012 RepID=UPI001F2490FC|nr:alpha/beta hydrolase [Paenibacillus tarimensis]MCF2945187.1 alpha/beta hydrolase [Paenibacillus tarimensis]